MLYQLKFDGLVTKVLKGCGFDRAARQRLWPPAATAQGIEYGRREGLPAEEAAAYFLAAGAMLRMTEGELAPPLATEIIQFTRWLAHDRGLPPDLRDALDQVEEDRRAWLLEHHEQLAARLSNPERLAEQPDPDQAALELFPEWNTLLDGLLTRPAL
jgi:hypothetical protein